VPQEIWRDQERVTSVLFLAYFWYRDFETELCQMITYNETLITTNFQVESVIGLRDMGGSK